jgi:hypothetical protein
LELAQRDNRSRAAPVIRRSTMSDVLLGTWLTVAVDMNSPRRLSTQAPCRSPSCLPTLVMS